MSPEEERAEMKRRPNGPGPRAWAAVMALALTAMVSGVANAPPANAADETVTRLPLADASIQQSTAGTNYGTNTKLLVDNSPVIRFLMRLDVSVPAGKVLKSATLSLQCVNASPSGGSIRQLTGAWTENAVTWNNAPAFAASPVATMGAVQSGTRYQIDLTAAALGRTELDVGWIGSSSDGADFGSKEASSAQRPSLVVVYGDATDPDPDPDPDPEPGEVFDLGLIGDTPYSASEAADLLDLRETMNDADLSYVVHIGDIKSGSSPCDDSAYTSVRTIFNGFEDPFVYTPGDNEWSDCSDKTGRLSFLRQTFYSDSQTLGQRKETVTRQANFPENARWSRGGILFATIHTVGSSNNRSGSEFAARNAANVTWLRAAFDEAVAQGSRGVVVMTHANWGDPYNDTTRNGFDDMKQVLEEEVVAFDKPVVFVHGDTHHFRIDHPLEHGGTTIDSFTRIEVHAGAGDWVRLRVVAGSEVFEASSM
jgi:hypothetical protein